MNALEELLGIGTKSKVSNQPSDFYFGTYVILKHDVSKLEDIEEQYQRIYNVMFTVIMNARTQPNRIVTTKRSITKMSMSRIVNRKLPLMVSSVEEKVSGGKSFYFSHHYIYGTHWHLENDECDQDFISDIHNSITNYIPTVASTGKNILVQPVGIKESQESDRQGDETIHQFLRSTIDNRHEDNILNYFCNISPKRSDYPLTYSYHQ